MIGNNGDVFESARTAFGELSVAQFEISAAWTFAYNINPEVIHTDVAGTGTVTHSDVFVVLNSGTTNGSTAKVHTRASVPYNPGVGGICRFTAVFGEPQENTRQFIGIINDLDGWAFGYDGLIFGILRVANGVEEFTPQSQWNHDTRPNFDPTKGNVFEIKYQWLGYGMQYFSMENSDGMFSLVHRISYANLYTDTSVGNPNLPITAWVENNGSATAVELKSPSAVAGSAGEREPNALTATIGYDFTATVGTGTTYLFSIRMPDTYEGKENRLYLEPRFLSLAIVDNTVPAVFRVLFGATLTGASWSDIITGVSPAQADTSSTAITGGIPVLTISVGKDASETLSVGEILEHPKIHAGGVLSVVVERADVPSASIVIGSSFRSRI